MNWNPPETAPKDGTPILGDFGYITASYAVWDEYEKEWCITTIQACEMESGITNTWLETDYEKMEGLKRWMPIPKLT